MLLGHPIVGMSWENFVIENILSVAPRQTQAYFYRTAAGAERTHRNETRFFIQDWPFMCVP